MATNPAISQLGNADTHSARPKVLIVGAGLGGLALGMILQKTDTPYEIFERAPEIKPPGACACSSTARTPPKEYLPEVQSSSI
jgi:flavin-dependent dehydrogenase